MVKVRQEKKRGYMDYRIQLQLLRNYLHERRQKKIPLAANELDLRIGKVLNGYKEAGLTDEQLEIIENERKEVYKKFGRKY